MRSKSAFLLSRNQDRKFLGKVVHKECKGLNGDVTRHTICDSLEKND